MGSKGFKVLVGVLVAVIVVLGGLLVAKNLLPEAGGADAPETAKTRNEATAQDVIAEPTPSVEGETYVPRSPTANQATRTIERNAIVKSIVGKSVTVVLLLAVAGGLAAWLVFGDKISAALSGEPQTVSPLTAPVERGSVQQTVTGVGEVKPLETVKLRPADSWHWLQSFDAPLNKRVTAGETLVTFANGEKWAAPYDLVVTSRELPEKNKGAVTKDDHYIEVQRIDTVSVTMEVSEKDLGLLSEGQSVKVKLGSDNGREYDGTISNINEVGTYGATGSKFTVAVKVPNDGSIKLGMSANLSITVAEASDVLTVPVSAVIGAGDDKFVQVYDLASGEQRAEPVTTGISNGTMVEVSGEGLKEGDLVVLNEAEPAGGGFSEGDAEEGPITVTPVLE